MRRTLFILIIFLSLALISARKAHKSLLGKYTFSSQSNWAEYLKAKDIGMLKRSILNKEKPDITIEIEGLSYIITFHNPLKTIQMHFILNQEFNTDIGFDFKTTYLPTSNDPNSVLLQNVNDESDSIKFSIVNEKLEIDYSKDEVQAKRIFERA